MHLKNQVHLCAAITYHFKEVLGLPPRDKWSTTISQICKTLRLSLGHNSIIKKFFDDVLVCEVEGRIYTGQRQYSKWSDDKHLITADSHEYQLLGESMEDGNSLRTTTELINEYQ